MFQRFSKWGCHWGINLSSQARLIRKLHLFPPVQLGNGQCMKSIAVLKSNNNYQRKKIFYLKYLSWPTIHMHWTSIQHPFPCYRPAPPSTPPSAPWAPDSASSAPRFRAAMAAHLERGWAELSWEKSEFYVAKLAFQVAKMPVWGEKLRT